ncbi:hypothetical protein EV360DRAFT_90339 [Lentinula raphanica]|nr:hypothetical protein EV360DRAFT_90339 [Lentinula raphanica]
MSGQRLRPTRGRPGATGSSSTPRQVRGTNMVRSNSSPLPDLTPEPEQPEEILPTEEADQETLAVKAEPEEIVVSERSGMMSGNGGRDAPTGDAFGQTSLEQSGEVDEESVHTMDSNKENIVPNIISANENELNDEQELTVRMAEASLSDEQKQSIDNRRKIRIIDNGDDSVIEGPSQHKGKAVDPKNWGALNFNEMEIDENTQRQILDSFKEAKISGEKKDTSKPMRPDLDPREIEEFLAWRAMRETTTQKPQVIPKVETSNDAIPSIKGLHESRTEDRRLKDITEKVLKRDYPGSVNDTSGAADQLAESNRVQRLLDYLKDRGEPSSPDSSGSETSENAARKKPRRRMRIKPIEPAKYSGEKDEQKFHHFAKASALYVKDGRVPAHREVNIVSNFLEGQAYTFYHSLCGDNPEEWTLYKFFAAMYNII